MSHTFASRILATLGALGLILTPALVRAQVTLSPGDLIKGTSSSTVYYYGPENKRYVFPNEKTYFTWYNNFNGVKTVSDAQLADMAIAGNVTYRPGVKMVKIQSDPKVYAVSQGGVLRHVTSEALAASLYGSSWNTQYVDDISSAFFTNYTVGSPIVAVADFTPNAATVQVASIIVDKNLTGTSTTTPIVTTAPTANVSIQNMSYSPSTVTANLGTKITWTNNDSIAHTVTSDSGLFDSGSLQPGQSFSYTFSNAGTFAYHCAIHPNMKGTITVLTSSSSTVASSTTY